jgi:hypothetical protein
MLGRLFLFLLRLILWGLRKEAVRLNLTIHGATDMARIGDSFTAFIEPTNAAGQPARVFDVLYGEEGESYDVTAAPDGMTAVFTARAAGTGNVAFVSAKTKGGATLEGSVALPDVESAVDEEAVALNFRIEIPVAPVA